MLRNALRRATAGIVQLEDPIVRPVGVDLGRAGCQRRLGVDHDGQGLIVDLDQSHRVLGHIAILGDNRGHGLAMPIDLVDRERPVLPIARLERGNEHRNSLALHRGLQVLPRDRRDDARKRQRPADVDALEPRMGMGTAREPEVQSA